MQLFNTGNFMRGARIGSTVFAGLMVFLPGMAAADLASFCTAYATSAVDQQRENIERGCGFQGLRWTNNGGAAFIYCMAAGEGPAGLEQSIRETKLAECRAAQGAEQGDGQQGGNADAGGGNAPGPADGAANGEVMVLPAGAAGDGSACKPSFSISNTGRDMDDAAANARRVWEDRTARQWGDAWADFDRAEQASFQCQIINGKPTCEATGQPCAEGAAGGEARIFPAGAQRGADCKAELRAAGAGNAYNIAGARARAAWEQSAESLYGVYHRDFDMAVDARYSCTSGNGQVICEAVGTPCTSQ